MQLSHLRYMLAVARHGSLSAAARALSLSQPTLTGALKTLEEELRTTLVLRGRDGVTLTEAGTTLVRHAQTILAQMDALENEIRGVEHEDSGRFVLGCHEPLGEYFLPSFMARFVAAAPRIELSLWNGPSSAVREAVLAREVHFGLVVNPEEHPELVLVRLFDDAVDFFVAGREPVVDSHDAALARISQGPVILAGRVKQSHALLGLLTGLPAPPRVLTCGDLGLTRALTGAGLGVGLLPRRVAQCDPSAGLRRLHPALPSVPDSIQLLFRGDLHRTRAARQLKDALVQHGRGLPAV
jgi:molybdate transport repressor ModE-like protein